MIRDKNSRELRRIATPRYARRIFAAAVAVVFSVTFTAIWLGHRNLRGIDLKASSARSQSNHRRPAAAPPNAIFVDVTKAAGIDFVHNNGAAGKKLLPETMGGGCAFLDYDNDGRQDILLINSCPWPWDAPGPTPLPTLKLYHNEGNGKFTDVTTSVGLDATLYGMGVAVGDYDNDGWVDVFVSAVGADAKAQGGPNRLFKNLGGKFTDVTSTAGLAGAPGDWCTGCAWIDYNNDGLLDLVVLQYVQWTREYDEGRKFTLPGGGRAYGRPQDFRGRFPYLYRNDGGGRFTEVGAQAGLRIRNRSTGSPMAKSLGLVPVDIDGDGWIDLVVANDTVQNFVFHNERNGTFREIGDDAQIAFDDDGKARGAMGIDAAYIRNDKRLAVGIGNFANEPTALYLAQPFDALMFRDASTSTGVGAPSRNFLKFGLFFFDYDLDGRLDLLEANGHLENDIQQVYAAQTYAQPAQLFWNAGESKLGEEFIDVPVEKCGQDFKRPMVGRGAAYADVDGDGDLDVLLVALGGPCRLLRNDQALGNHWLRFKLVGRAPRCNRDAIGAWIEVKLGEQWLRRQVMPTRSYLSQVELPVTIGIGKRTKPDAVRIRWPDGSLQQIAEPAVDRPMTIEQRVVGAPAPAPSLSRSPPEN